MFTFERILYGTQYQEEGHFNSWRYFARKTHRLLFITFGMDSFPKGGVSTVTRALSVFKGFMAIWIDFLLYTYTGKIRGARAFNESTWVFHRSWPYVYMYPTYTHDNHNYALLAILCISILLCKIRYFHVLNTKSSTIKWIATHTHGVTLSIN